MPPTAIDDREFINSTWNPENGGTARKVEVQDFTTDSEELVGMVVSHGNRAKIADTLIDIGVSSVALRAGYGSETFIPPIDELEENSLIAKKHKDQVFAICGPTHSDLDRSLSLGVGHVVIQATSSRIGMKYRMGIELSELIRRIVESISYAKSHGLRVSYMTSDSTRADEADLKGIINEAEMAGADAFVLSDSNGCSTPEGISNQVRKVLNWTSLPVSVHCHNDYGLATANALAGASAGASFVQTCALGIGERSGLASLEEVALSCENLLGVRTGLTLSRLVNACREIAGFLRYSVPPKKAVVGYASVSFEGERFAQSLAQARTQGYRLSIMPYLPEIVGGKEFLFLGSYAGPHSARWRLESLGIDSDKMDDMKIETLADMIRELARDRGEPVSDALLTQLYDYLFQSSGERRWNSIPYMIRNFESKPEKMFPGVVRRTLAQSNNMMVVEFRFDKGAEVPLHKHPNEQCGYVASGEVCMQIGGTKNRLVGGDPYMISSGTDHGTIAVEPSILVDVFSPPRSDYAITEKPENGDIAPQ